jgi:two-component system, OmpR family, sensor histidine kinase CssS
MNRRLSSRILVPNLIIVTAALLLLAATALFLVRLFLINETTSEFKKVRDTVEMLIKARNLNSLEEAQAEAQAQSIIRVSSFLYDAKLLILTPDMQYTKEAETHPLPDSVLASVPANGSASFIQTGNETYLAAAVPFKLPSGEYYMVIFTSIENINDLVRRLAVIILPALIGAALLAALASVFVARRIAGPLGKLSRWAHSIGGRKFERYTGHSSTAEIDTLAESLNGMAQRLKDYDAAQKTFLQNASHELRTPLMSIQGYAEGIKHGIFADTGYAADIIVSESLRLTTLVENLLYLTKLETADGYYSFAPVSIAEVLGQCAEKLEGIAIKEGKKLTLLPCPEAVVNGDGEKLLRAVMNLAGNCLRYAKTEVELKATMAGQKVAVTIRDDGPGFDTEDIENMFIRFYKGKQGKFGLGLSIAKAIIEKHGGSLSAKNGEAGGAVFTVELPVLKQE